MAHLLVAIVINVWRHST